MFRPRLATSLAAMALLALLSGTSATVLAGPHDNRARHEGPPPKAFKVHGSHHRDRHGYRHPSHRPYKKWDRAYYGPPRHRPPAVTYHYYEPYRGKPYWRDGGSGSGLTIIWRDHWR